jgi:hypothetical protein
MQNDKSSRLDREDEDLAMALKLSEQEAKEKEQQSMDQATSAPNFGMLFNPYHHSSSSNYIQTLET